MLGDSRARLAAPGIGSGICAGGRGSEDEAEDCARGYLALQREWRRRAGARGPSPVHPDAQSADEKAPRAQEKSRPRPIGAAPSLAGMRILPRPHYSLSRPFVALLAAGPRPAPSRLAPSAEIGPVQLGRVYDANLAMLPPHDASFLPSVHNSKLFRMMSFVIDSLP